MSRCVIDDIWADYRNWLLEQVQFMKKGYDLLMTELHNSPFEFSVDHDENRAEEGLELRDEFLSEYGLLSVIDFKMEECSVLEMLVALAIRIDNEYTGEPGEPHPEIIFWEMVSNLGLDKCTDRRFRKDFVYKVLSIWIKREFERNGVGSIFPLKHSRRDQRDIEIWAQMNEYLTENY